jgi:hypothetical protein
MNKEEKMNQEYILKRLLDLSVSAHAIGNYELSSRIRSIINDSRYYANQYSKGPNQSVIEFKDDGPYLNGKRIDGIIDLKIESKTGFLTIVSLKLTAKLHGLDDITQKYQF